MAFNTLACFHVVKMYFSTEKGIYVNFCIFSYKSRIVVMTQAVTADVLLQVVLNRMDLARGV